MAHNASVWHIFAYDNQFRSPSLCMGSGRSPCHPTIDSLEWAKKQGMKVIVTENAGGGFTPGADEQASPEIRAYIKESIIPAGINVISPSGNRACQDLDTTMPEFALCKSLFPQGKNIKELTVAEPHYKLTGFCSEPNYWISLIPWVGPAIYISESFNFMSCLNDNRDQAFELDKYVITSNTPTPDTGSIIAGALNVQGTGLVPPDLPPSSTVLPYNHGKSAASSDGLGTLGGHGTDVSAPSEKVWTTAFNRASPSNSFYGEFGGSSSATPIIGGVVGLMLSANPTLTPKQVRKILRETQQSNKITDPNERNKISGMVNAYEAVRAAQSLPGGIPSGGIATKSVPNNTFSVTHYNPPTYNGFQIVLLPGAHHIPISANQIAAFGIQSPDPDNMQVIIDGRSMPIRQVAQDYLTFGLPADLAPGVKDVIIKLAGDTVTLQEALEVLALPPLELVQTIPTTGGYSNVSFTLGNDTFMVMNNVFDSKSSAIYKWNGSQFAPFQTIPLSQVSKGYDVEHFQIDGQDYLAFADWGDSSSQVYRWDGSQFAHLQSLYADLSTDAEHFTMNGEHFLIFANYGGDTHNRIYKWNGSQFVPFQSINISDAFAWESIQIGNSTYLAVALYRHEKFGYNHTAQIYKWNGSQFSLHQSLEAENPLDFEAFQIGEDHFFAMTNTGSTTAKSRILKWNPSTDRFDEFQTLNTTSPQKVTHFVKEGVPHLIFGHDDANPIYRWTGTDFELYRTLIGSSKWEWSFVRAGDKSYLLTGGVYSANGSYDTQSEVYLFE